MEFARRDDAHSSRKITTKNFLLEKYPLDLTFYMDPPDERVSIDEIREMSVQRVKLFRAIEIVTVTLNKGMSFKDAVIGEMTKQNLKYFMPLVTGFPDPETRRRDHLSHYMLRICYCRSEDYKKWFVAREIEFFRLKFMNIERKEDLALFMKKNELTYSPISDEEKQALFSELMNCTFKYVNLDTLNFYKVHFTEVLDLVRKRKVFVKGGNAYVPQTDLYSVLSSVFKKHLIEELDEMAKNLLVFESDQRVNAIVKGLHTCYDGKDYCSDLTKQSVSKENLNALSSKSFPLCMKAMHETLKTTHHLRYGARLQYGLFLKGIGLSMEESLKFWKEHFTKKPDIDADVFEKRYAYSIRHSYGNEGKRANYTPHNCMKIITTNVGPGDNHGCPFKHYDNTSLKKLLLSSKLTSADINCISDYAIRGHYQLACTKYFEVTHNVTNINGINHPNQYFEDSQNFLKNLENKDNKKFENNGTNVKEYKFEPKWEDDIDFSNLTSIVDNAELGNSAQ